MNSPHHLTRSEPAGKTPAGATGRGLCYHGGRLKFLEHLLNAVLAIVFLAIVGALVYVWHDYDLLYGRVIASTQKAIQQATGLHVRIGSLGGFWWHELEAKDVRVYASAAPHASLLAYIPVIKASYSPLGILRMTGSPTVIEVDGPILRLRRDARGHLDLPAFPSAKAQQPPSSRVPLRVIVHDGIAFWKDDFQATASQKIPFEQRFDDVSADVTWTGHALSYTAQARDGDCALAATGTHDLATGRGRAQVQATAIDLPTWTGYGLANDTFGITKGTADLVASASYDVHRPQALAIAGKLFLSGVSFAYENVVSPIENIRGTIGFDRHRVRVERLAGDVLGNAFTASGSVDLPPPGASPGTSPRLDFAIGLPAVDLATLPGVMPAFATFGPAGSGHATVHVSGNALNPEIAIDAGVRHAVFLKETLGPGTAKVLVRGTKVTVDDIVAGVQGGVATGSFWFTTDAAPRVGGDIHFSHVGVHGLATPLLTHPLPLAGRADGLVTLSGPISDIDVRGRARLAHAAFGHQAIASGRVVFRVFRGNVSLPAIALSLPGGGRVSASGGLDGSGDLALHVAASGIDLAGIRRAGFPVSVTGTASGSFDLSGNAADADTWQIAGNLTARAGSAYGQPVRNVSGRFGLKDGVITLARVVGHSAGAAIRGHGTIGPISFDRRLPPPDVKLDVNIRDADLARIAPLVALASPSLGAVSGHASIIDGQIDYEHGQFGLSGALMASRIKAARAIMLRACSGQFALANGRLSVTGARLLAGDSEVDVDGSVGFGSDPAYDLHVRTVGADLRSVLDAVAWRTLLEGPWLGGKSTPAGAGHQTLYAELPGREGVTVSSRLPLALWPIYQHWQDPANRLPPLQGSDIFLITRYPFWKALDGRLDGDIRISGRASAPAIAARMMLVNGRAYGHDIARAVLAGDIRGSVLDVGQFDVALGTGGSVRIQGGLGSGQRIVATAQGLDLSWLDPWLTEQQLALTGRAGGRIVVSGSLADPSLQISASANQGSIDAFAFDQATANATLEDGVLDIGQLAIEKDGKQAVLSGQVPLGLRPEDANLDLSLDVEGDSLGIMSVLTGKAVTWKGGQGSLRVRVLGTEAQPRLAGGLALQGATLGVAGLDEPLTNVDARVLVGDGIVKVDASSARLGGGQVDAAGYVTLDGFKPGRCDLQVTARKVQVNLANHLYSGSAEAALHIGGRANRPALSGMVSLSDGQINLPVPQGQGESDVPVDLQQLVFNLRKTVRVYQPNLMQINIAGNLIVNGTLAEPDPRGTITIVPGGTITPLYTNEFRVERGAVEFTAPTTQAANPGDPWAALAQSASTDGNQILKSAHLHVVADGTVTDTEGLQGPDSKDRQVKIIATITGSLDSMLYQFDSDPAGYTEAQIESMLGKSTLIQDFFSFAEGQGGATGQNGATSSFQPDEVTRAFAPGVFNFFVKRYLDSLVPPWVAQFFSDYSVNVVSNVSELQTQGSGNTAEGVSAVQQGPLAGYDLALSLETVQFRDLPVVGRWPVISALPLTVSYQHTFRQWSHNYDLDSLGLNYHLPITPKLLSMPLGVTLSSVFATNDGMGLPGPVMFPLGIRLQFPTAAGKSESQLPVVTTVQINLQGRF